MSDPLKEELVNHKNVFNKEPMASHTHRTTHPLSEITLEQLTKALEESGLDLWVDTKGHLHFIPEGKSGGYNLRNKWASVVDVPILVESTTFFYPLLAEALYKVYGERHQEYGPMYDSFKRIADAESAVHGQERSRETVSIDNIIQKLVRLKESPDHYDSLVDIVGYVLCYRDNRKKDNPEHYHAEETRFKEVIEHD